MPKDISYCGIDCAACPALVATRTDDSALRAKTAAEWSKSYGHDFKPEDINCSGCSSTEGPHIGYCSMCEIRKCAVSRKLQNCASCAEYECATLAGFHKNVPEAKARLDAIRAKTP
ncbi:DUF3795 domain-containing protein [candidate division WOR-3 bacterium]|nr:DUF3795 domain-containing protein [candidate division WOR-3 bacterium]